jgi:hypothetical protein
LTETMFGIKNSSAYSREMNRPRMPSQIGPVLCSRAVFQAAAEAKS